MRDEPEAAVSPSRLPPPIRDVANYSKAVIVMDASRDSIASCRFDDLLREAGIVLEAVTEEQAKLAGAVYRDFGCSSGNPARLNFGDCFAYALATANGEPLLYKGDDFACARLDPI